MEGVYGLRAGVIGPSGIGRVHIDALRRIGVEVSAIASSSLERAKQAAEELGVPAGCGSIDELVQREDVDCVHVCTPNAFHAEHVRLALAAGKHVVCEKPLAPSLNEAGELVTLAKGGSAVCAVAYNYRHYPAVQAMREIIGEGALGNVHLAKGGYLLDELLTADPGHWLLDAARRGSSLSLADVGVHWWDLLEYVTGQRVRRVVCTHQAARANNADGEDSAVVLLKLDGGATAVAAISGAAPGHGNTLELEVIGTKASVRWQNEDPDRLFLAELGRPVACIPRSKSMPGVRSPRTLQMPAGHVQGYLDAFRDLIANVYEVIQGDRDVEYPDFEDGARGIGVLEALMESAMTEGWVDIPGY